MSRLCSLSPLVSLVVTVTSLLFLVRSAEAQLPAPTGLTASQHLHTAIQVRWNVVDGADRYELFRIDVEAGSSFGGGFACGTGGVKINVSGPGYDQFPTGGAGPGLDSYFRVRAIAPNGAAGNCSGWVNGAFPAPQITQHPQPQRIWLGDSVTFQTNALGAVTTFYWQRALGSSGTYEEIFESGNTLTFTPSLGDNNYRYRVRVRNESGTVYSNGALLQVDGPPQIVFQPTDTTKYQGQTATFSVTANGYQLAYNWQWLNNNVWTNIAGAQSASYSFGAASNLNGLKLRVRISNGAGFIHSSTVTLTVLGPPVITQNPSSLTVPLGAQAVFNCSASGAGLVTYQWFKNDQPVNGETSTSYGIPQVNAADNSARIACQASNPAGSVVSSTAILTVQMPATATPVHTATSTPSRTPTRSATASHTATSSRTPTHTITPTRTATRTPTLIFTPTTTVTPMRTATPTTPPTQTSTPFAFTPTPVQTVAQGSSSSAGSSSSSGQAPLCSNGDDDDRDGSIDYPDDLGCDSSSDQTETNPAGAQCDNGLDDDGDGFTDLFDSDCTEGQGTFEIPPGDVCRTRTIDASLGKLKITAAQFRNDVKRTMRAMSKRASDEVKRPIRKLSKKTDKSLLESYEQFTMVIDRFPPILADCSTKANACQGIETEVGQLMSIATKMPIQAQKGLRKAYRKAPKTKLTRSHYRQAIASQAKFLITAKDTLSAICLGS